MATPNYEEMALDLSVVLHKWETQDWVDIVDNPDEILAGAQLLMPFIMLAIRISSRLRRR
jgi:hypothetical protein